MTNSNKIDVEAALADIDLNIAVRDQLWRMSRDSTSISTGLADSLSRMLTVIISGQFDSETVVAEAKQVSDAILAMDKRVGAGGGR